MVAELSTIDRGTTPRTVTTYMLMLLLLAKQVDAGRRGSCSAGMLYGACASRLERSSRAHQCGRSLPHHLFSLGYKTLDNDTSRFQRTDQSDHHTRADIHHVWIVGVGPSL